MPPKGRASGQRQISTFFKSKDGKEPKEIKDASESDVEEEAVSANTPANSKLPPDMSNLPPINEIPAMFKDLVSRIPKIQEVVKKLNGRKLRVATMCSGTESPLLALDLISRSIKDLFDLDFGVEHIFSCEIEPFKQAYIERNFRPPILFRDVCELGGKTAYVHSTSHSEVC